MRRCGASTARSRSLVDVLPVEPVTPMTCAPSSRRQAVASFCRAFRGSSAARTTPVAPPCPPAARRAAGRRAPPRPRPRAPRRERAAVDVRTGQADEQRAGADGARVDRHALRPAAAPVRAGTAAMAAPAADATVSGVHCFIGRTRGVESRSPQDFTRDGHIVSSGRQTDTPQALAHDGDVVKRDLAAGLRTPGPARVPCRR